MCIKIALLWLYKYTYTEKMHKESFFKKRF